VVDNKEIHARVIITTATKVENQNVENHMAHFVKLNQLDLAHDNGKSYVPILFNLDTIVSIEPSPSGKHSIITTRWSTNAGIRVKETLDEILALSKDCTKDKKAVLNG